GTGNNKLDLQIAARRQEGHGVTFVDTPLVAVLEDALKDLVETLLELVVVSFAVTAAAAHGAEVKVETLTALGCERQRQLACCRRELDAELRVDDECRRATRALVAPGLADFETGTAIRASHDLRVLA